MEAFVDHWKDQKVSLESKINDGLVVFKNSDKVLSEMADKDTLLQQNNTRFEEIENRLKNIEGKNANFQNDFQTKQILMNLKPLPKKVLKQFICETCGKNFTSNYNKKSHIKTVHDQIKEFKCEICGKAFGFLSNKKAHLNVHKNK